MLVEDPLRRRTMLDDRIAEVQNRVCLYTSNRPKASMRTIHVPVMPSAAPAAPRRVLQGSKSTMLPAIRGAHPNRKVASGAHPEPTMQNKGGIEVDGMARSRSEGSLLGVKGCWARVRVVP